MTVGEVDFAGEGAAVAEGFVVPADFATVVGTEVAPGFVVGFDVGIIDAFGTGVDEERDVGRDVASVVEGDPDPVGVNVVLVEVVFDVVDTDVDGNADADGKIAAGVAGVKGTPCITTTSPGLISFKATLVFGPLITVCGVILT